MDYRKSLWADKISSMLRKTEVNLLRLQCSFTEPRYSGWSSNRDQLKSPRSEEMQKKLYEEKEAVGPSWSTKQDLEDIIKGFEKIVQSKIREQQNSLDYLADKVAGLEGDSEGLQNFRVSIEENVRGVESRCKEQIGEIEGSCRKLVTVEEMRKVVDEVRAKGLEVMKRMQREVDEAKFGGNEVRDKALGEIESKVQGRMGSLVSKSEFFRVKEDLEQRVNELVRESEGNMEASIERTKKGYRKSCKNVEHELTECENGINSVIELLNSRLETIEESVNKGKKQDLDEFRGLKSEIERLEALANTSSLEERIKLLEKKSKTLPKAPEIDLSEFAVKSDLNIWASKYEKVLREKKTLEVRIEELEQKIVQIGAKIKKQKKEKKRANNLRITKEFSIEGISTFGKPGFLGSSSLKADFSFAVQTFSSDILNFSNKHTEKIEELNIILTPNLPEKLFNEPENEKFYNLIEFEQNEIKDFPMIGEDKIFTPSLPEKLQNDPKIEVFSELLEYNQENGIKDFPVIGKNIYNSLSNSSNSDRSGRGLHIGIGGISKLPPKNVSIIKSLEANKESNSGKNGKSVGSKSSAEEPGEKELVEDAFNEFVEDEIGVCCQVFKANMYPLQDVSSKVSKEKEEANRSKKTEMNWMELDSFSSGSEEESDTSSVSLGLFNKT